MRTFIAWAGVLLTLAPAFSLSATGSVSSCSEDERRLAFITTTGSAINLDVSPDGGTLVFDMLGDLYTVPAEGGAATRITHGSARDVRPVWSPDGHKIAFISDRQGDVDAPYILDLARNHLIRRLATGAKSVTVSESDGNNDGLVHVEWYPSGSIVFANNMMAYKVSVTGSGDTVTKIEGSVSDKYYSNKASLYRFWKDQTPVSPGNQVVGSGAGPASIEKFSRGLSEPEGLAERVASVVGEPPVITPDGRWLIYRDIRPDPHAFEESQHDPRAYESTVRIYDRISHVDRVLIGTSVSKSWRDDGVEYAFSAIRRFAVSPDSETVYVSYAGQVHRLDLATGEDTEIPIEVEVDQCMAPMARNQFRIKDDVLDVRNTRSATQSPGGRHLVFNALRKLYVMELPNGSPKALIEGEGGQFYPAYSPDGQWIAFVTWGEVSGGHVWRIPSAGGQPEKLTISPGYYGPLEWSPDGSQLAFVGSYDVGKPRSGFRSNLNEGNLHVISVVDRIETQLPLKARLGDPISFSADGTRVFYTPIKLSNKAKLASVRTDGMDSQDVPLQNFKSYYAFNYAAMSPTGQHVAVIQRGNLFLFDCSSNGKTAVGSCRSLRITQSGAYDPRWREGGALLEWSYGSTYFRARTEDLLARPYDGFNVAEPIFSVPGVEFVEIKMQVERRRPHETIALKDARIISMQGDSVIERGTILVRGGRIEQVGPSEKVDIPKDAEVIGLGGKTIMPGLVDSHAHVEIARDLLPQNHWELLVNLAFGVTTIRDPSNGGHHGFQYGELVESGMTVGPRIYGAMGFISDVADLNSYEDATAAVKSMKLLGGTFVKYHTGYSRQQRQWLSEAARREGLNIVAHYPTDNGATQLNLTTIADGATTVEHEISETESLFDDVRTLLVKSGVGVSYADAPSLGGRYHQAYWSTIEGDPRTRSFLRVDPPKSRWDSSKLPKSGLAPLFPPFEHVVTFLADIDRLGVKVLVGSHGNYDGIGMHWSMWAHARGGMSNLHVLRAATLNGAWGLGLENELGSIEVGKVADLLILAENPLEDIRNTLSIEGVMKDGVLRESTTLDEIWPTRTPLPAWQYQDSAQTAQPH